MDNLNSLGGYISRVSYLEDIINNAVSTLTLSINPDDFTSTEIAYIFNRLRDYGIELSQNNLFDF